DHGNYAMEARGYRIYSTLGGGLSTVVDPTTVLDGHLSGTIDIGPQSISRNQIAFVATYTGGSAIYLATAAISFWDNNHDGNWSDSARWTGGIPNAIGAAAHFEPASEARVVHLDIPVTLGGLGLNGDSGYTIEGSSTLTLQSTAGQL